MLLLLCFRYIIDETSLIINDIQDEDEGVYGCEIITSLDTAEASGSLTVVGMGGKKICGTNRPHKFELLCM